MLTHFQSKLKVQSSCDGDDASCGTSFLFSTFFAFCGASSSHGASSCGDDYDGHFPPLNFLSYQNTVVYNS